MITGLLGIGAQLIDKLIPDQNAKQKAQAELLRLEQRGDLKELEISMSAIIAEAKSKDKWTSRARPSFLYVVYIMILASIPMGILFAINPSVADAVITGVREWLEGIPEALWTLFGAGYLGYTGARSYDKHKGIK